MKKSLDLYKCVLVKDKSIDYIGSVSCVNDVENAIKKIGISDMSEEYFGVFCLNVKGQIIAYHEVSHGEIAATSCHPRDVFKRALLSNSAGIVCVHNHPSGFAVPSDEDLTVTKRLKDAGKLLGIELIDHLIIGLGGDLYSFRTTGFLS